LQAARGLTPVDTKGPAPAPRARWERPTSVGLAGAGWGSDGPGVDGSAAGRAGRVVGGDAALAASPAILY